MADWTNLPNTAVGVGGLPSGTTVTALRDNPVAIAEGATGAPRVNGKARTLSTIVSASVTGSVNALQIINLPAMREMWIDGSGFLRDATTGTLALDVSFNNGSSWTEIDVAIATLPATGGTSFAAVLRSSSTFTYVISFTGLFLDGGVAGGGDINAIRLRHSSGSGNLVAGTATVIMNTGALEP